MKNNINVNEVLAKYTREKQKELITTIKICALLRVGGAPKTQKEFEEWAEKEVYEYREKQKQEKEKEEKRIAKKFEKAKALGLTVEKYEEYERLKVNLRRLKTQKEKTIASIEKAKKKVAREEKLIAQKEKELENLLKNSKKNA